MPEILRGTRRSLPRFYAGRVGLVTADQDLPKTGFSQISPILQFPISTLDKNVLFDVLNFLKS
jgi:hypothetical protein